MTLGQILFYIFAAVIIFSSILAVTTRRILRAAVYLLFVLGSTAGIYYMLDYLFLAAVQIIVYVGGIVVLIIFSILLTSEISDKLPSIDFQKSIFSFVAVLAALGLSLVTIIPYSFPDQKMIGLEDNSMKSIGTLLLSFEKGGYVLPFEVISILLLAAMVAAIIIARDNKSENDT